MERAGGAPVMALPPSTSPAGFAKVLCVLHNSLFKLRLLKLKMLINDYSKPSAHISQTRKLRPLETDNVSEVTTPESVNSKVSIQTGLSDTTGHVLFSGLLLFSLEAVSDSLRAQGLQHARLPCPLSFPGVCSTSCPLSPRSYLTISSSAYPFSFWTSFSGLSII